MNERPTSFRAGDTVKFSESYTDRPSSSWTLTYFLRGANSLDIAATPAADGTSFDITFPASATAKLEPGLYDWTAVLSQGSEAYTGAAGKFTVLAKISTLKARHDARTHARRTLDLIEAAIERHATNPVQEIEIAGRRLIRPSLKDLIEARSRYRYFVRLEENQERLDNGLEADTIVRAEFGRP